jgi:hypothetical protein
MWGKKARIYYHGLPLFCVSCYRIGHARSECDVSESWKDYIVRLRDTGIPVYLFGSWLSANHSTTRESQYDVPQPEFEKPDEEENDDAGPDFSKFPPQMLKFFKQFQASTPKNFVTNPKNIVSLKKVSKPKPKPKPKLDQNRSRGRGRGRGRGAGAGSQKSQNPRGRGKA